MSTYQGRPFRFQRAGADRVKTARESPRGAGAAAAAGQPEPLRAALGKPKQTIGYQALYETFTRVVRRALATSGLDEAGRRQAMSASLDGGAAVYFRAQIERRQKQAEKAFG